MPGSSAPCDNVSVRVSVHNTGTMEAAETVQAYVRWHNASVPTASVQLVAFEKVLLRPGQRRTVTLTLAPRQLAVLHNASTTVSPPLPPAPAPPRMAETTCAGTCGLRVQVHVVSATVACTCGLYACVAVAVAALTRMIGAMP